MIYIEEKKVREYFNDYGSDCEIVKKNINNLKGAYNKYINNSEYTGEEAEAAKAYVKNVEKQILNDIWLAFKELKRMQKSLLSDFTSQVDNSKKSVIYTDKLDVIKQDFKDFRTDFNTYKKSINEIYSVLEDECSHIQAFSKPDATKVKNNFNSLLVGATDLGGGMAKGIIPGAKSDFHSFEYQHQDDIKGSTFEKLCDAVDSNIEKCDAKLNISIESALKTFTELNKVELESELGIKRNSVATINEEGEIEFDNTYIEHVLNGGFEKMPFIEQELFLRSFRDVVGPPVVGTIGDDVEDFKTIKIWWGELVSGVSDPITLGGFGTDGVYAGVDIYIRAKGKMPKYRGYTNAKGTKMVAISDSTFYKGGRGGIRSISEAKLLSKADDLAKNYRANCALKTTSKVLVGIGGALAFYDEYKAGEGLKTSERITNATVESAWSVGSAIAIGAAVGSVVPGAGTVAGAAVGFVAGAVISVVANSVVHAKWFDNGEKSAMDYVKGAANKGVDTVVEQGKKVADYISDKVGSIGNATASWFAFG